MFRGEQSFTKSQIKEIKKLYLAGEGYPRIAKKYKVGKTTVEGLILDLKVTDQQNNTYNILPNVVYVTFYCCQ